MPSNIQQPVKGNFEKEKELKRVTSDTVRQAKARFEKYKTSRSSLNQRLTDNEQFWKMRHWEGKTSNESVNPTGWLLNAIHSKHADMMDGFPEPNIRAKEESDVGEAKILSEIVPVVLEQTGFKKTYSKVCRDKINKGTGAYGIFWDNSKHFGLGDISIEKINLLNLYFEPEVEDIQKSRDVFYLTEISKDDALARWPQLKEGQLSGGERVPKYINEESVDENDKVVVFDWYYKKYEGERVKLHYCKFVGDTVLYASEDDMAQTMAPVIDPRTAQPAVDEFGQPVLQKITDSVSETGWYEHGMYPFVLDTMFPVEDSAFGYGYTDLFKGTQEDIDILNHSIVRSALLSSKTRYFAPASSGINKEAFANMEEDIIEYEGTVNDVFPVQIPAMPSIVVDVMNNKVEELKEVSGNRDVNNGSTSSGVTAASAIAALQEFAGKTSRDSMQNTYEKFKDIVYQVIELIRQFYDTARQFRIVGEDGQDTFTRYSNANIRPQSVNIGFGLEESYRVPQFDIIVSASKATAYSKLGQNEFALQLYNGGFFVPNNADVALSALKMMDFDGKEKVIETVKKNGTLFEQNQMLLQAAMSLAAKYEPQRAAQLQMMLGGNAAVRLPTQEQAELKETNADGSLKPEEHGTVAKARERSQLSTQVG